jgi:NAD(P)-dependent dehydrogenase (short-subunit alcohol dehydrogenase family)
MTMPPKFLAMIVGGSSGMGKKTAKRLLRRDGEVRLVVNAVSPAVVVSPIYGEFIAPDKIEETLTTGFNAFHPIGRVGRVDDVAAVIDFLLSDEAGWVTGVIWTWTAGSWPGGIKGGKLSQTCKY